MIFINLQRISIVIRVMYQGCTGPCQHKITFSNTRIPFSVTHFSLYCSNFMSGVLKHRIPVAEKGLGRIMTDLF